MKRLISLIISLLAICGLLAFSSHQLQASSGSTGSKVLNLYNWGDYIDPHLLTKFQQETGYHVNVETFDSNEAMYTKINQGGTHYDLAIPSEYMVAKMKRAHLLQPLDHHRLTGLHNYDRQFLHQSFDPHNRYSLPYFWGTLGIIYNDKFIQPGTIRHWNDLWSVKYRDKIMLIDSARDIMGMALVSQGQSMNTTNPTTLRAAEQKLTRLAPNVKATVADEIKMYMTQNEAPLAVDWSGEAAEMLANNSHLHYVVPSEGSNLWIDNLVIPKTAQHYNAIYAFLNFMSEPQNAAQNAEYVGYATPNRAAKALLPTADRHDQQFYPPAATLRRLEVYRDLSPAKVELYNDLYLEFKMHH
ncbi:ABC transporter substrate-binding protein [Levilactobacillus tujiorum]|uniref:ABC transporter substrate-binding protein n=1 Tax=Levilactobacillus tujiorum TaxID=2912243 RepID=A0ABX1L5X2_9LACO|nr:ABC transporter substrate-binding protein [Levilactobacillus tujiorum]MCH5465058.1 ABC transporter substrate-binding protein [Levilactobacillus tujiorum]NLR12084.1 ABC transporter substrate-binding protein [Lactobacillus sp. HBUAS51387]NLR30048.1 ABC transporter substrate-binding protein [Levilactobacillus tujiorum]